jgi:hypothetical protein
MDRSHPLSVTVQLYLGLGKDASTFVAGLSKQKQTIEMHLSIAKTISYIAPGNKVAVAEYQKAIKLAREQESEDKLKTIWLQQMKAYFDSAYHIGGRRCAQGHRKLSEAG